MSLAQSNNDSINTALNEDEIDLRDIFKTIKLYKWSIISTAVILLCLACIYLYFKPFVYSSYAIIEVRSDTHGQPITNDFLFNAFSVGSNREIEKEIEILKTFQVNKSVLDKINLKVQYFIKNGFTKTKLYDDLPIEIKNIKISDKIVLGKTIKLIPVNNGFHLEIEYSKKTKLISYIGGKKLLSLDNSVPFRYDETIKTDYFTFTIRKSRKLNKTIYFKIHGDHKYIYDNIIKNKLKISQLNKQAPLIKISYEDNIPQRAADYINALIDSFLIQSVSNKRRRNNKIIDFIENQLKITKRKLEDSENQLEQYRISNKLIESTTQSNILISDLSDIDIKLSENELNQKLIQNVIEFMEVNENIGAIAPLLKELNDSPTLELITELQKEELKKEVLNLKYTEEHPDFIAIRNRIYNIRQKIFLNIQTLKSRMAQKSIDLEKLKKVYEKKLITLPTSEKILINMKRSYEVNSKMYTYLLEKKAENEILIVAALSDYKIIERAYKSSEPIKPKRSLILMVSLITGLIMGVFLAFLRNFLNDKIQNREDIENRTSLPIYGILPFIKKKIINLEVFNAPKSHLAESCRSLRTNLQFSLRQNQSSIILITSTISKEGKTTITANLSAVFQLADYKCIILNLDLRNPKLHTLFDVENSKGISTYLSGIHNIDEVTVSTPHDNLDIIPAGPIPPNPAELIIMSDRLESMLAKLKKEYDYIFIDTSPFGLVSDTSHLMKYSDINLIIFREEYSKKVFISDLNNIIKKHKIKKIGLLLNSSKIHHTGSYGYGYGYEYKEKKRWFFFSKKI